MEEKVLASSSRMAVPTPDFTAPGPRESRWAPSMMYWSGGEIYWLLPVSPGHVDVSGLPGSTRPSREEKMLLSRTGVIRFWTDIRTLRPELNSGPRTQRTYGSRPLQDGGQAGPDSWLRHRRHSQVGITPEQVRRGAALTSAAWRLQ